MVTVLILSLFGQLRDMCMSLKLNKCYVLRVRPFTGEQGNTRHGLIERLLVYEGHRRNAGEGDSHQLHFV